MNNVGSRARGHADGSRPKVLVLLASHNGAPWIAEQIQSILAQTDVDVRIHIRDDLSTDATRDRIAPFIHAARVELNRCETPTGSAAQNFFALIRENSAESFDYIALADQDDVWCRDKLARACRQLMGSSLAGYSSASLAVWENGKSTVLTQNSRPSHSDFLFGGIGQGCTFVLTKGFYDRARLFLSQNSSLTQEIHYHDWALYALARTWSLRWVFDPTPTVRYRQHDRNDTGARSSISGLLKRLDLIKRGWYGNQLRVIVAMCAAAAPGNEIVSEWRTLLSKPDNWSRRAAIVRFCVAGGRRSCIDNAMLLLAGLRGWV